MIVNRLERMVVDAFAHEEATHALERLVRGVMIERYGSGAKNADQIEKRTDEAMAFIRRYVGKTPEVMAGMMEAAGDAGLADDLLPMFVAADDYFARSVDFIPDHLGLAGITDDAYMVQSLIQRLCDSHAASTGTRLMSVDLTPANELMRRMIGEPVATALDATVREVMGLPDVQTARERLVKCVARLKLRMPEPYMGKVATGDDLDLNIGALGGKAV